MTHPAAATLDRIARDILGLETLATRHADSLDFHDLAVWTIRNALLAAYEAGVVAGAAQVRNAAQEPRE